MPEIKKIPKNDFLQFAQIAMGAFPGISMENNETAEEFTKYLIKRSDSKHSVFYGLYKKKYWLVGFCSMISK